MDLEELKPILYNLQPLMLETEHEAESCSKEFTQPAQLDCFFCEVRCLEDKMNEWTDHLLEEHGFMVGELNTIASLPRYIRHWKKKLSTSSLEEFCVICTAPFLAAGSNAQYVPDSEPPQVAERKFYMLSPLTCLEDRLFRNTLRKEVLECVLNQQQKERDDNSLELVCLFCHQKFCGNRSLLLNHMNEEHNFNIGHPDNIVFASEFIQLLHEQMNRLLCLYCEKTFKNHFTLKEHMRKKLHKRLNPNNSLYDRFYLINYLGIPKYSKSLRPKRKTEIRRGKGGVVAIIKYPDSDEEDDWEEDEIHLNHFCLFCEHTRENPALIFKHMAEVHSFNMKSLRRKYSLTFYHQVKLINYIRRQVLQLDCLECQVRFEDHAALMTHMTQETDHLTNFVGDPSIWNHPEYFFPTYEDDNIYSGINIDYGDVLDQEVVIPEDPPRINLTNIPDEIKTLMAQANMRSVLIKSKTSPLSDPVWSNPSGISLI